MAVLQPRMRVVMFRISEPEYQTIRSACETSGARSFSDFARSAVLAQAGGPRQAGAPSVHGDPVADLQQRVRELEQRLNSLTSALVFPGAPALATTGD